MNTLLTAAVGLKYQKILVDSYYELENEVNFVIYTDNVQYLKSKLSRCDIRKYKHTPFRYFDKYTLTYQLTREKKQPIIFCDAGRLNDPVYRKFFYFDKQKIDSIYTNSNWSDVENLVMLKTYTCPYFEDGYWNNIIEYFESTGINLLEIVPLLEQLFVFPYEDWVGDVIKELETNRLLFEKNSKIKQHIYTGIGNGEGIALSYALNKTKSKHKLLRDLPIKPFKII